MYLTKIDLLPHHRDIQRRLGDCQQFHQMIMGLFESDRKDAQVLYRVRQDRNALAVYLYKVSRTSRPQCFGSISLFQSPGEPGSCASRDALLRTA